MIGLTARQSECLGLISAHIKKHGVAPTSNELLLATGLASKSGIHRLLTALEARGAIRRMPRKARAIEIIDPLHACPNCGHNLAVA